MTLRDARFADWMVGSLRSGVVGIDREGAIRVLSPDAARILAGAPAPADAWLGRPCREVLAAQPRLLRLLTDALDGRERPTRAELQLEAVGPRPPCTIGYTVMPVRDAAGAVRGAAVLFRDLTPFERRDGQARLDERLRALGEMAAGLAHEIRNPLASMEVLAGLLKRQLQGEALGLVEELLGELRGLAATVTAALAFVRPDAPAREPIDPEALLDEALAHARARVPFAGRVERRVVRPLPPASADPERLRAALTHLLDNAFQAMADPRCAEPVLRLGVAPDGPDGRGLCWTIADSGPGIPDELRERIFYPFFTTREQGSGVGLAEAQKIVGSHGGILGLESRPGAGATFRVHLPPDPEGP